MTDPRQLDVRTVHRYIRKGVLTPQGYEQALQELPNLEGEAEFVDYEQMLSSATSEAAPAPESVPVFVDEPVSAASPVAAVPPLPPVPPPTPAPALVEPTPAPAEAAPAPAEPEPGPAPSADVQDQGASGSESTPEAGPYDAVPPETPQS